MRKFAVIFISIMCLVFSNASNAILITDSSLLTSEHYVTYTGNDITIDYAWASMVNVEYFGDPDLDTTNRLYAPETHQGWGYADAGDLEILFANFTLDSFTNGDGTYIQAVSFWNTVFDDIVLRLNIAGVDMVFDGNIFDYTSGKVSSSWASAGEDGIQTNGAGNETFYVRKTLTSTPKPIPEPLTNIIFSTALIALQIKLRKKSV